MLVAGHAHTTLTRLPDFAVSSAGLACAEFRSTSSLLSATRCVPCCRSVARVHLVTRGSIGAAQGVNDLVAVSNNAGVDDFGLGLLLNTRQVRVCLYAMVFPGCCRAAVVAAVAVAVDSHAWVLLRRFGE